MLKSDLMNMVFPIFLLKMGVPHIFAENDKDLFLAQGYLTARERMFQWTFFVFIAVFAWAGVP